uniref:Replication associated protein n=1 Tax=Myotis emarginatus feces associated gemycircularvirus 1 TaxID=3139991 RepID=A0AAU6S591_9VIRU
MVPRSRWSKFYIHLEPHMSFNFNARYALLTYSQCGELDGWAVSNHFTELRAECIVAREAHSDGGSHLHAFVDFGRKFRSRRADVFDVGGYHPNISPTHTTPQAGFDYACKDGDIVAGGLDRPSGSNRDKSANPWPDIVAAESREEFYAALLALAPRSLCTSFPSLEKYADWKYRTDPEPYRHDPNIRFDMDAFPELNHWVQEYLQGDTTPCITRQPRLLRRPLQPRRTHSGRRIRNLRRHQWRHSVCPILQVVAWISIPILCNR